jgi:carbamoyl-phosphate synthase large subunit
MSKLRCAEYLRARRLPFLPTVRYTAGGEVPFDFPMILKPEQGVSSRGVYQVNDADELRVLARRVDRPILQPYIEGDEFTIDVLCNRRSGLISAVPRKRIETKAGLCTKGATVEDADLLAAAAEIAPALQLVGPANLQCRRDTQGALHFFEVNPRFGSASPITKAAGVNQPLVLLKLTLGLEDESRQHANKPGVLMMRHWQEVFRTTPA